MAKNLATSLMTIALRLCNPCQSAIKGLPPVRKMSSAIADDDDLEYTQGQEYKPGLREFFCYISPKGMLFMDDDVRKNYATCFNDKKFLQFFYKRLQLNTSDRYNVHFPYLSIYGTNRIYVRCDNIPIIYTQLITTGRGCLSINRSGFEFTYPFFPHKMVMSPYSGLVYHPCKGNQGGIGVMVPPLGKEFTKSFIFDNGESNYPTHIVFNGEEMQLDHTWLKSAFTLQPI